MEIKDTYLFNKIIEGEQLKPCMKTILNDIKTLSKGAIAGIIQRFSNSILNYNWILMDATLSGGTGETSPNYDSFTGIVTTTFDTQSWQNATELSWARTILHESIHAYLVVFYKTNRASFISNYAQMVQDWGVFNNWNDVHHEEFARSLVNSIADALEEYGQLKGYTYPRQFYEDMSWAGLQETTAFEALPEIEQTRILNTISIELTGKDIDGQTKSQKGANAGC